MSTYSLSLSYLTSIDPMKRLIFALLAVLMIITVTACGKMDMFSSHRCYGTKIDNHVYDQRR